MNDQKPPLGARHQKGTFCMISCLKLGKQNNYGVRNQKNDFLKRKMREISEEIEIFYKFLRHAYSQDPLNCLKCVHTIVCALDLK